MKYFIYHAICKTASGSQIFAEGLFAGTVVELFEMPKSEPESWCFTCVLEITEQDYHDAKNRGVIG